MGEMVERGIALGLGQMCFTEHMDFDFPVSEGIPKGFFEVNTDAYLYELLRCRAVYGDRIKLCFGVELGLQAYLAEVQEGYVNSFPFDFIIGSSHLCNGKDPYDAGFFAGRSEEAAYREYFESIIDNLEAVSYTHLDVYKRQHEICLTESGPAHIMNIVQLRIFLSN